MDRQRKQSDRQPGRESGQPQMGNTSPWFLWLVILALIAVALFILWPGTTDRATISYTALQQQVEDGNVAAVTLRGLEARGTLEQSIRVYDGQVLAPGESPPDGASEEAVRQVTEFESAVPEAVQADFIALLERHGVDITAQEPSGGLGLPFYLLLGLPILLILGLILFMSRAASGGGAGREFMNFTKSKARLYDASRPKITFADVAGEDQAKAELMQVVDFLKSPDKFHEIGARLPRGVLLVGPPGTGKTLLAKAVAGEAGVPFYSVSASEFVEMFVGVGAGRVRDLFEKAKQAAPAIVFIDELDAVGRQRFAGVGSGNDEREQTLNQVLVEMDGFDERDEVIVMSATNRPDVLDPALLRPGRFDRQVALGLPDKRARQAILGIHVKRVPLGEDVRIEDLARATPGFSGADLANLVNEAALVAARKDKKVVEQNEFNDALDRIVLGAERPLVLSEQEKKIIAYHEAGHALVAWHVPGSDPLRMVSIIPRGQALGVTMQAPAEDRFNYTRRYLIGRLAILMGGRSAESLVFDEMTTGAQNDLKEATQLARRMVGLWGMSDQIGPYYLGLGEQHIFLGREMGQERSLSDELLGRAEAAAQELIAEAMAVATNIVREHRDQMDLLVERLMEEETLTDQQIAELLRSASEPDEEEASDTESAREGSIHVAARIRQPDPPKSPGA